MELVNKALMDDYFRWQKKLCDTDIDQDVVIKIDDVLRAHYLICDYFIEEGEIVAIPGPQNENLLISAIFRPSTGYSGITKWKEPLDKVATLFYGLVKNHAFHDGNKRTALLITIYYLQKNKRWPKKRQKFWEKLTLDTASNDLDRDWRFNEFKKRYGNVHDARVHFISDILKRSTRFQDKSFYLITYKQLQTILNRFGYEMKNPHGNYIDVVKKVKKKQLFRKPITTEQKVVKIGFPGWTKEVSQRDLKYLRKQTSLTAEKGYDSKVFYKDEDPMAALIHRYHEPLLRLKDK